MDIVEEARRIVREANEKARLDELKKARIRTKVQQVKECVVEMAPVVIAAAPLVITTGDIVTNIVNKASMVAERRAEKNRRERSLYDRSEMHYWNLKRKLTNKDWAAIYKAKGEGKRLGDILKEMKLLK